MMGPMSRGGRHQMGGKKASKKTLLKLGKYLRPYKYVIVLAWVLSIIGAICTINGPRYLGKIMTELTNVYSVGIDFGYIKNIGFVLITIYIISAFSSFLSQFMLSKAIQKATNKIRSEISIKINKLPLAYFDSTSFGDVLSRVTNDVDAISQNLNQSFNQFVSSLCMLVGVLFMLFKTSWILALVTLVVVPLSMIAMGIIIKFSQKHFKRQQRVLGELNGHIEEIYSAQLIVKAFNKEEDTLKEFQELNEDLRNTAFKSQFLSGLMMPLMVFFGNLSYIALGIVGGNLMTSSNPALKLNLGDVTSVVQYSKMSNQPIQQMGQIANVLQTCAAATQRVMEFLDEKELEKENPKCEMLKQDVKGYVEFKNVNFQYTEDRTIINNFSCNILPGQKVAIVGPTGAGKTTIVNLLMRFYETNSGDILIDGVSIKDITRENVASLFGMVLQDTWLFEGTILDNLKFGNDDIEFDDVIKACKECHVDHFINTLSNDYNHILDEYAAVSEGQKQLITIARAMIENAPMLILDEATSSVDTRTEVLIQKSMDRLMEGRTSFVIAHRLSTIKNADIILVMKDGNIIEQGNHAELMSKNGFYTSLYNSQFSQK